MRKSIIKYSIYFVSVLLFIFMIQVIGFIIHNEILLPSVWQIIKRFFKLLGTGKTYLYIGMTLKNLVISLVISFAIGMIFGILAGVFPYVRIFLKPWITILRSIPLASSLVIFMILCGFAKTPYYVCSIMLIPLIYEGFCQGILSLDSAFMDVWKLNSNLSLKVILRVHIPLILSYIKTAFISAVGMGIKVIIMAEYLAGIRNTLGSMIMPSVNLLDYTAVYAYSIIMVILVILLELLPKGIARIYSYCQNVYQKKISQQN